MVDLKKVPLILGNPHILSSPDPPLGYKVNFASSLRRIDEYFMQGFSLFAKYWVAVKELKLSYYIIHHNGESDGKQNGK